MPLTCPSISKSLYGQYINISMAWLNNLTTEERAKIKSIALMEKDQIGDMQKFIIARNGEVHLNEDNWHIGIPVKNFFTRRQ